MFTVSTQFAKSFSAGFFNTRTFNNRSFNSVVLATVLLVTSPAGWAGEDARHEADQGDASIQPADNLCFGGLEDGKIIVSEPYLKNPYRETTRLGCEVDGGAPETMPDLPAPDAARHRLV